MQVFVHDIKRNPNQLLIFSMEVAMYIGLWTLKVKGTQYGLYGQAAFKSARVTLVFEVGWSGHGAWLHPSNEGGVPRVGPSLGQM
jgi:hypothetical protein